MPAPEWRGGSGGLGGRGVRLVVVVGVGGGGEGLGPEAVHGAGELHQLAAAQAADGLVAVDVEALHGVLGGLGAGARAGGRLVHALGGGGGGGGVLGGWGAGGEAGRRGGGGRVGGGG